MLLTLFIINYNIALGELYKMDFTWLMEYMPTTSPILAKHSNLSKVNIYAPTPF